MGQPTERPFAVGVSFRTADSRVRDKLYIDALSVPETLSRGRDEQGLTALMVLSTCDRVEVIGAAYDPESAAEAAERLLLTRLAGETLPSRAVYRLHDTDAVRHVFRIASALDSQMVGESQILGQLKDAIQAARDTGTLNGELDRLVKTSLSLAKRVRSTTKIGEGSVSVAAAAVRVAQDLHGDLKEARALLIGLGETGSLIAEQFQRSRIGTLDITGPSRRTEREAGRRGLRFIPFARLSDALVSADIVITSADTGRYVLDKENLELVLDLRRRKPVLILDVGVPSDVDPAVDSLADAFLYRLSDVERLAEKGQMDRHAEAQEAEAMIEGAVLEWRRSLAEQEGIPGLVALRDHFETLRSDVLARHPNADGAEATRLLVNRLLHAPSETLRDIAQEGEPAEFRDILTVNRVVERLFHLRPTRPSNARDTRPSSARDTEKDPL